MIRLLLLGMVCALAHSQNEANPSRIEDFSVGALRLRPGGFFEWVGEGRSARTGDTVNTRFASAPLHDSESEFLTSVAHSRVMLHAGTPLGGSLQLMTYLEADFLQSANRAPWRWRQYWGELQFGKWNLLGGQGWSLLRPNRSGAQSDVELMNTLVVEPAYHIGLVGARRKQLRLTREFTQGNTAAFEWESGGRLQAKFAHDTGAAHLEATVLTGTRGRLGLGLAQTFTVHPKLKLIGEQFVSRGGGPEMLGILPARVKAYSTLEGIESALRPDLTVYGYGGIVYGERSGGNRAGRQYTFGAEQRLYRSSTGTIALNAQFSQFDRQVWEGRSGAVTYGMGSLRYTFAPAR